METWGEIIYGKLSFIQMKQSGMLLLAFALFEFTVNWIIALESDNRVTKD